MKDKTFVSKRKWMSKDRIDNSSISYQVKLSRWYSSADENKSVTEFEFNWNEGSHNNVGIYIDLHNERDAKDAQYKLDVLIDSLTELRDNVGKAYQEQIDA